MASGTGCVMMGLLVVLAVGISTASAYHATTASTIVEIDNPRESEECRHQVEMQRLRSCREYLKDSSRFMLIPVEYNQGRWREEFPRCCEELEQINEQCRCQAIQKVVEEEEQVAELKGREMREMLETAQSLGGLCRISPKYCDIGRGVVF